MNRHEIKTIRQEALRFLKDIKIIPVEESIKLELPFTSSTGAAMYMFVGKPKNSKKFILLLPAESAGLRAVDSTSSILQKIAATYNVILTQEVVLREETQLPLHQRIRNMTQLLIGIDGIVRLWKVNQNATKS
jgi:hypothetical protein